MTKEELYRLTGKFLDETLTAEEKERLEQWYHQGADGEIVVSVSSESSYQNETELRDSLLRQIRAAIANEDVDTTPVAHRVHFLKTSWFRAAAAVILIVGAGGYFWLFNKKAETSVADNNKQSQADVAPGGNKAILTVGDKTIDLASDKVGVTVGSSITYTDGSLIAGLASNGQRITINTLSTPRGGQYRAVLPDGSKVWLNAASSVRFPSKFSGSERTVEITGEAYLEVAQDSRQPFTVKANGVDVQVLGTSFNVNAYTDEDAVRTTLIDGSVRVSSDERSTVLMPGQQCSVVSSRPLVAAADIDQVLAWKNGFFNFHNADLATVLRQLERWYDIEVKYAGKIPTRHFNGELPRSLKLSQVISVLDEMEVKFRIEGKTLIVMS